MNEKERKAYLESISKECEKCHYRIGRLAKFCPICSHAFPKVEIDPDEDEIDRQWRQELENEGCSLFGHLLQRATIGAIYCTQCGGHIIKMCNKKLSH